MKPLISMAGLCAALFLQACDRDTVAGTNNETHTKGTFYQANGKPAVGARVRVYSATQKETDSTTAQVAQEYVDAYGNVDLKLKPGHYSLVADSGSISAFIDSIFSDGDEVAIPVDTLRPTGTLTGYIRVQPMHSPSIAWVHLMRTNLYTKVDSTGFFRLANVPAGSLDLVAVSHLPEYTPTHKLVRALPESTVHVDTIDLVYNGLPLVTGIAATYDTLTGVVTLTWHDTAYARKAGYVIYRQEGASSWIFPPERGYAESSIFRDTVFGGLGSLPSRYDSAEFDFTYWVGVKGTDLISRSPLWNKVSLHAKSPALGNRWKVEWTDGPQTTKRSGFYTTLDTIEQALVLTSVNWVMNLNRRQVTLEIFDVNMNRRIIGSIIDTNYDEIEPVFWKGKIWRLQCLRGSRVLVDSTSSWLRENGERTPYMSRPIYDSFMVLSSRDGSNWDTTRLPTVRDSVTAFRIRRTSERLFVTELFDRYMSSPGAQTTIPLARYSTDGTKWTFESNPNPTVDDYTMEFMTTPIPAWTTNFVYTDSRDWTVYHTNSSPWAGTKSASYLIPGVSSDTNASILKLPSNELSLRDRGDLFVFQTGTLAGIAQPDSPAIWQRLSLPIPYSPFCFWRGRLVTLGENRLHFATITPNQ